MALGVLLGVVAGISLDVGTKDNIIVQEVTAEEVVVDLPEPLKEVQVEVVIDWTEERIKEEIRKTFPEDPETAIKVAGCESGLKMLPSRHVKDGVQEPSYGIFQIHAPSWDNKAKNLGFGDYKNDIQDNIKMARYIYEARGSWYDWSCHRFNMI